MRSEWNKVSQAKFSFRHRGHRTGVHTSANSTPLEGPWTPLQQPYTISRRAGPGAAKRLAPPGRLKFHTMAHSSKGKVCVPPTHRVPVVL